MVVEFFRLTGDEGSYRPPGKLDRLPSKKTCFQQKNGRFQTGFRGAHTAPSSPVTYDLHGMVRTKLHS